MLNDMTAEQPWRVREHGGDRCYTVIGYHMDACGVAREIVIPDYVRLGEPLPPLAEALLPIRYYTLEEA